jgi:hypothetical protein
VCTRDGCMARVSVDESESVPSFGNELHLFQVARPSIPVLCLCTTHAESVINPRKWIEENVPPCSVHIK